MKKILFIFLYYSYNLYAADISWTAVPGTTERDSIYFKCVPMSKSLPKDIMDHDYIEVHPSSSSTNGNPANNCFTNIDIDYSAISPENLAKFENPSVETFGQGSGSCVNTEWLKNIHCLVTDIPLNSKYRISMDMILDPWLRSMNDGVIHVNNGPDEPILQYTLGFQVQPKSTIEIVPQSPIPAAAINKGPSPANIQIINKGPSGNSNVILIIPVPYGISIVGGGCFTVLPPDSYVRCRVPKIEPGEKYTLSGRLYAYGPSPVGAIDLPVNGTSEVSSFTGNYPIRTWIPY